MIEKVAFTIVTMSRQLRPYFQNHRVFVKTDYPVSKVICKPDLARRMIGWSIELSEFDIKFERQGLIKSQCLVDFAIKTEPKQKWRALLRTRFQVQ